MTWLKLTARSMSAYGQPMLVNMDQVVRVTPASDGGAELLTNAPGKEMAYVLGVRETPDQIEAMLRLAGEQIRSTPEA